MRLLLPAIALLTVLSACTGANYSGQAVKPDETTEQFVARVINSSNGVAGY